MKVTYNKEPGTIQYMPLPDGRADVWLRKKIEQTADEEGNVVWTADEIYFRTNLSEEDVHTRFETLYENGGDTLREPEKPPTVDERLDAVEAAILELAEVIANG